MTPRATDCISAATALRTMPRAPQGDHGCGHGKKLFSYRGRDDFCDPFCGSGTIPIEAALIAKNRALGLDRGFTAMSWKNIDRRVWEQEREAAKAKEYHGDYNIVGSDIDPKARDRP